MKLAYYLNVMWATVFSVLDIEIQLFEFHFTFLEFFMFGMVIYYLLVFLLGFGQKE